MTQRLLFMVIRVMTLLAGSKFVSEYEFHGSVLPGPKHEGTMVLRSAAGPVRLSAYQGKVVLLYLGYTSCPDVCPTSLAKTKAAFSKLSTEVAAQVQVIFLSVDPDRDTPERLEQYAHVFGPDFIGASGTRGEIDSIAESLGVYDKINLPDQDGNYTVDHSSYIYVIDQQGYVVMNWGHDIQPTEISANLKYFLKHGIPIREQIPRVQPPPRLCAVSPLCPGMSITDNGFTNTITPNATA